MQVALAEKMNLSIDLRQRSNQVEWLDGADINAAELTKVLHDLAAFNNFFFGHLPILQWLGRAVRTASRGEPLILVDIGCGYGDLLRAIRRWADRRSFNLTLIGIDLNQETISIARRVTDPADRIDFRTMNALDLASAGPVDFIVSSLVTHHLSDQQISEFMRLMESVARRGWAICDLQRNRFLYHFIGLSARIARFHPMIRHDGQISVARSLTRPEWQDRIADARLSPRDVKIHWFLFRYLVERLR
jgi:SAM-dependent methyltransferase